MKNIVKQLTLIPCYLLTVNANAQEATFQYIGTSLGTSGGPGIESTFGEIGHLLEDVTPLLIGVDGLYMVKPRSNGIAYGITGSYNHFNWKAPVDNESGEFEVPIDTGAIGLVIGNIIESNDNTAAFYLGLEYTNIKGGEVSGSGSCGGISCERFSYPSPGSVSTYAISGGAFSTFDSHNGLTGGVAARYIPNLGWGNESGMYQVYATLGWKF